MKNKRHIGDLRWRDGKHETYKGHRRGWVPIGTDVMIKPKMVSKCLCGETKNNHNGCPFD